jgi:hypothetical protein
MFIVVFTLEAAMKLVAFGPGLYFKEGWNRFDFVVVVVSLLGLFVSAGVGVNVRSAHAPRAAARPRCKLGLWCPRVLARRGFCPFLRRHRGRCGVFCVLAGGADFPRGPCLPADQARQEPQRSVRNFSAVASVAVEHRVAVVRALLRLFRARYVLSFPSRLPCPRLCLTQSCAFPGVLDVLMALLVVGRRTGSPGGLPCFPCDDLLPGVSFFGTIEVNEILEEDPLKFSRFFNFSNFGKSMMALWR